METSGEGEGGVKRLDNSDGGCRVHSKLGKVINIDSCWDKEKTNLSE